MSTDGPKAERLFVDLCSRKFLKSFVFHSPKYLNPTECEAGDVVVWLRRIVIVFEVVRRTREDNKNGSKSAFRKRIGRKRDQLTKDFLIFNHHSISIQLTNELGETIHFDKSDLFPISFFGVVIVDSDVPIERLHSETIQRTVESPFPIAVMTRSDFNEMVSEIDTIPDLYYYLEDRFSFLKNQYKESPNLFLDLNTGLERNLLAHYKMNNCAFTTEWSTETALSFASRYETDAWKAQRSARDRENSRTFVIDDLIDFISKSNRSNKPTVYHAWELAHFSRRERSHGLSTRIADAFRKLGPSKNFRYFAVFNPSTGCWLVFLFAYGISIEEFEIEVQRLSRMKTIFEIEINCFQYSVFGFGFRKSAIETTTTFDDMVLTICDATSIGDVSESERSQAKELFGQSKPSVISEFPSN